MCLGTGRKRIIRRGTLYHIETDEEENSAYLETVQMYFEMCRLIKKAYEYVDKAFSENSSHKISRKSHRKMCRMLWLYQINQNLCSTGQWKTKHTFVIDLGYCMVFQIIWNFVRSHLLPSEDAYVLVSWGHHNEYLKTSDSYKEVAMHCLEVGDRFYSYRVATIAELSLQSTLFLSAYNIFC